MVVVEVELVVEVFAVLLSVVVVVVVGGEAADEGAEEEGCFGLGEVGGVITEEEELEARGGDIAAEVFEVERAPPLWCCSIALQSAT